jgi:hypothetical protein
MDDDTEEDAVSDADGITTCPTCMSEERVAWWDEYLSDSTPPFYGKTEMRDLLMALHAERGCAAPREEEMDILRRERGALCRALDDAGRFIATGAIDSRTARSVPIGYVDKEWGANEGGNVHNRMRESVTARGRLWTRYLVDQAGYYAARGYDANSKEAVVESAEVFAEYHVCNTHETGPCELCKPVRALAAYRKERAL